MFVVDPSFVEAFQHIQNPPESIFDVITSPLREIGIIVRKDVISDDEDKDFESITPTNEGPHAVEGYVAHPSSITVIEEEELSYPSSEEEDVHEACLEVSSDPEIIYRSLDFIQTVETPSPPLVPEVVSHPESLTSRRLASWFTGKYVKPNSHFDEQRRKFNSIPFADVKMNANNPHGKDAKFRSVADHFINDYIKAIGCKVYSESMSRKDMKAGFDGSRLLYQTNDLSYGYHFSKLSTRHSVKMVDVDWFIEDFFPFLKTGNPIVMYTYIPNSVGLFNTTNELEVTSDGVDSRHSGGSKYRHKIWDWRHDTLFLTGQGIGHWGGVLVNVESRKICDSRYVVALIPRCYIPWPLNYSAKYLDNTPFLSRFIPDIFENIQIIRTTDEGEQFHSMHEIGTRIVYKVPDNDFHDCVECARMGFGISIATLERITGNTNAYHLRSLFTRLAEQDVKLHPFVAMGSRPRSYQPQFSDIPDDDATTPGSVVTPPIVDSSYVPTRSAASDHSCAEHRIEGVRPVTNIPESYYAAGRAFVKLFRPKELLAPHDEQQILECATGSRRTAYYKAQNAPNKKPHFKTFQKAEAYPSVKPPRNINDVDKVHVTRYSRFTQPVMKYCASHFAWYAFSRPPTDIANSVHQLVSAHQSIVEGDFSKMDGSLCHFLRTIEVYSIRSCFHPRYHQEITELHEALMYQNIKMSKNTTLPRRIYNSGSSRHSGSSETSLGNTVIDCFCFFLCLMECGLDPNDAWSALGLFGGDDSLQFVPDDCQEVFDTVFKNLGLKMKFIKRNPGDWVYFLGRAYSDPWTHPRSCFDPTRFVNKFHYSSSNCFNVPLEVAAWRKALSLYVTDSQTPFVGSYCRRILEIVPGGIYRSDERRPWLENIAVDEQRYDSLEIIQKYAKAPAFPGCDRHERQRYVQLFLDACGVSLDKAQQWISVVKTSERISQFPTLNVIETSTPTFTVETDGQLMGPKMTPAKKPTSIPKSERQPCRHFQKGDCKMGKKCRFQHVKVCRAFQDGKCHRKRCKFAHLLVTLPG